MILRDIYKGIEGSIDLGRGWKGPTNPTSIASTSLNKVIYKEIYKDTNFLSILASTPFPSVTLNYREVSIFITPRYKIKEKNKSSRNSKLSECDSQSNRT